MHSSNLKQILCLKTVFSWSKSARFNPYFLCKCAPHGHFTGVGEKKRVQGVGSDKNSCFIVCVDVSAPNTKCVIWECSRPHRAMCM